MRIPSLLLAAALLAPSAAWAVAVGEPAPPLAAQTADGQWQRLQDWRGKVVYVDFWAAWCGPCREAMPQYERLYRQHGAQGLVILGVNVDTERQPAEAMLKRLKPSFPVVFDPKGQWAERFALPAMPSAYLIDRRGVVRYVHVGYKSQTLPELERKIAEVLAEGP